MTADFAQVNDECIAVQVRHSQVESCRVQILIPIPMNTIPLTAEKYYERLLVQ